MAAYPPPIGLRISLVLKAQPFMEETSFICLNRLYTDGIFLNSWDEPLTSQNFLCPQGSPFYGGDLFLHEPIYLLSCWGCDS